MGTSIRHASHPRREKNAFEVTLLSPAACGQGGRDGSPCSLERASADKDHPRRVNKSKIPSPIATGCKAAARRAAFNVRV
jgi:hypothetical protein